jgi:hypothetical protein
MGTAEAMCGHVMPSSVKQQRHANPPNVHDICGVCRHDGEPLVALPPQFGPQQRRRPVLEPLAVGGGADGAVSTP